MKKNAFLLALSFAIFSNVLLAQKNELQLNYTSVHYPHELWSIPFFAPSGGTKYYTDFHRAFEIISVTCDDKEVAPKVWRTISAPAMETVTIKTKQFIYTITYDCIASIAYVDGKVEEENKIKGYDIPRDAKQLVVKYIVHYPDQTTSPLCEVTSVNVEYLSYERQSKRQTSATTSLK